MTVVASSKSLNALGKKIREAREQRKLSQEEVAKEVGISVTYYAGIERGEENPTYAVIESLCIVLKILLSIPILSRS